MFAMASKTSGACECRSIDVLLTTARSGRLAAARMHASVMPSELLSGSQQNPVILAGGLAKILVHAFARLLLWLPKIAGSSWAPAPAAPLS